jgi:branched-chain amino acid aminotransferase
MRAFIRMNGGVLPWDPAQVHILPHALHYEPVCFGGLRTYEAGGNAVIFCGPAHFERRDLAVQEILLGIPEGRRRLMGLADPTLLRQA